MNQDKVVADGIRSLSELLKNTLINGCALGSNKTLYQFFHNRKKNAVDLGMDQKTSKILVAFADAFMSAIEETFTAMFRFAPTMRPADDRIKEILLEPVPYNILEQDQSSAEYHNLYDMCFSEHTNQPAVLQPIDTDIAIVRRFGEVALRFVKTARLVSEGGIYVNQKKDS